MTFLDGGDTEISSITVEGHDTVARWELAGDRQTLPIGTRSVRYRFEANDDGGLSIDTLLDDAFVYVHSDTIMPNQGAYGNTATESTAEMVPRLHLRFPDLYVDWERDTPRRITWDSFANDAEASVRIDLYQDGSHGPELLTNITASTTDDGEFLWIPFANSGIDYDTEGLRIEISLVGNLHARDRSTEPFRVPEDGSLYYVNTANDVITDPPNDYTTAPGDNRNSGKRPDAPKPNPVNVLRVYELTSGAQLLVDPGSYPLIDTIALAGSTDYGLGLDRGFQFLGPVAGTATLQPAINNNTGQTLIFMDDADLMTIRDFRLVGGRYALHSRNGSTGLIAENLDVFNSQEHGLLFEGGSSFTELTNIDISSINQFDGVHIVGGAGGTINNLTSQANERHGLYVENVGTLHINGAEFAFNDDHGILQDGFGLTGTWNDLDVHDNQDGIFAEGNVSIVGSEVYDNADIGIDISSTAPFPIDDTSVYGNAQGVNLRQGTIRGSRIFDNAQRGVSATFSPVHLIGNTFYSNTVGFYSDPNGGTSLIQNNVFYAHGTAAVRLLRSAPTYTLVNNTIYETAADGVRATDGVTDLELRNNIIWTNSGYGIFIANDSQIGFQSDFNLLHATGGGEIGYWLAARPTLQDWQFATFADDNSFTGDPWFVDANGADNVLGGANGDDDNLHVQSQFGSYRPETGQFVVDAMQSPAIDAGDDTDSFANETVNNGGYINIGAYGNTAEASRSPAEYILIKRPNLGDTLFQDASFDVRWRSDGLTGNVLIEVSTNGMGGPFLTLGASELNDGTYSWLVDSLTYPASDEYAIRISSIDQPTVSAVSSEFTVAAPIDFYYVNDNSLVGDEYAIAVGNDANDGLSPATPKASIRGLLETYDLEPGATILVDTGTYNLTTNIEITAADSGVTIQGPLQIEPRCPD